MGMLLDGRRDFLGRDREVAAITRLLGHAESSAQVLVLEGVGGIGKSRLLSEVWAASAGDSDVTTVRCSEHSISPIDVAVQLVTAIAGKSEAGRLVAATEPGESAGSYSPAQRAQRLASIATSVLRATTESPRVIAVDDMHWCGQAALSFFEAIVDALDDTADGPRLLLVFVSRPLPSDHPVRFFLERVGRLPLAVKLTLDGLSEEDESALAVSLHGQLPTPLLSLVRRSANGNPLHTRAVLEIIRLRGLLVPSEGLDPRLLSRIGLRMDRSDPVTLWLVSLPAPTNRVVSTCAVLGDEFTVDDAISLSPLDVGGTVDALDAAIEAGVLNDDGQIVWFAHPHYREILYRQLGPADRQDAHTRCAELLHSSRTDSIHDQIAIGNHLLAGNRSTPLPRFGALVRAGDASMTIASWSEAARYYEAALKADEESFNAHEMNLYLSVGRAHYFNHDPVSAMPHLRRAIASAVAGSDEESHCSALVHLMWCANSMAADALREPATSDLIDEFLATARDQRLRSRAFEVLAESQIGAGQTAAGEETARLALEAARDSGDAAATAFAQFAVGYAHLTAARIGQATTALTEAAQTASRSGDAYLGSGVDARLCYALLASGDLGRADEAAGRAIDSARQLADFSAQALAGAMAAQIAACVGDTRRAEFLARQTAVTVRRSGHNAGALFLAPLEASLAIQQADFHEARAVLERWPELPGLLREALSDLVLAHEGSPSSGGAWRRPRSLNLVAGLCFVIRSEAAVRRRDKAVLRELLPALNQLDDLGLQIPPGYPVLLTRLIGDVEAALGDDESSIAAYGRAEAAARSRQILPELARTLIGTAIGQNRRPGSPAGLIRRNATEALRLADRVGARDVSERASMLLRGAIDDASSIEARGGRWSVILSSDVEGSTAISNDYGDIVYHEVVTLHHQIVLASCEGLGGVPFSDGGDGLMLWFDTTASAIQAAIQIQAEVRELAAPHLSIKIGLAGGEPLFRDSRPYGLVVNRAARMESEARGGEIYLDEAVASLVGTTMPTEDRGLAVLKGIGHHRLTALLFREPVEDPVNTMQQL